MDPRAGRAVAILYAVPAAMAAFVVFVVLSVVGIGWVVPIVAGLVVAVALAAILYTRSDGLVLRALRTRPLDPADAPRLANLVDGLCVANGFREPSLHLVDSPHTNAAAVGRSPERGAIVVTTGFRDQLRPIEMEGVLAHLMSRIDIGDTAIATHTSAVAGMALGWTGPLAARLADFVAPDTTLAHADMAGVELTRYPPGLCRALMTMAAAESGLPSRSRATNHLWVAPPGETLTKSPYSLDDRIALLQEL